MTYDLLFFIKDIGIGLLLLALLAAIHHIKKLKDTLEMERRKRRVPLLSLKINTDSDLGIFLLNDSYCYARNIHIEDFTVIIDYGFKKNIILRVDPLEMLKPNKREKLNYHVFDSGFDVTTADAKNILNHFFDTPIEIRLRYENIEGDSFSVLLSPEKEQPTTTGSAS